MRHTSRGPLVVAVVERCTYSGGVSANWKPDSSGPVLETIAVAAPRPRRPADDPALAALRDRLHQLFQSLEPHPRDPTESDA